MGLSDRDYMQERHRGTFDGMTTDSDRPFAPRRQQTPTWFVFLFWVALGFALRYGVDRWLQHRSQSEHPKPRPIAAASVAPDEPRVTQASPPRSASTPEYARPVQPRLDAPRAPEGSRQADPGSQAAPPSGRTIYLCRAYNGGTFWAQAHCNQHKALIESIVPVPPGLPFEQQVELAEQRRRKVAQAENAPPPVQAASDFAGARKMECLALDRRVEDLDAIARQRLVAQTQDRIREERRAARDRQFALRC